MCASQFNRMLMPIIVTTLIGTCFADVSPARQAELNNLLTHDCGSCHGLTRNGGLGPALHAGQMKKYSVEALMAVILHGIPDTAMPPWASLLNDDDARYLAEELLQPKLVQSSQ